MIVIVPASMASRMACRPRTDMVGAGVDNLDATPPYRDHFRILLSPAAHGPSPLLH
ncbi:MAG: hypothetical protein ACK55I_04970 [bacterium]